MMEGVVELSKRLRTALVKRGAQLRERLELAAEERQRQKIAAWIPPSRRVEQYIIEAAARLGLGRKAVEETLSIYRRLESRALVGRSPRVIAVALIYAATCTPAVAAAEVLGVSPISVKATVYKLKLAVKMCGRRDIPRGA